MRIPDAAKRGLPAGVAAVCASFAYAGLTREFVVAPLARVVVRYAPDALVTFGITVLGSLAQPLVLAAAVAATVALFTATGALGWEAGARFDRAWVGVPVGAALSGALAHLLTTTWEVGVVAGLAVALVLGVFAVPVGSTAGEPRRRLLKAVGGVAAGTGVGALLATQRTYEAERQATDPVAADMLATAEARGLGVADLEPLVSRNFYTVDINVVDPRVAREGWSLTVTSEDAEATYDLDDLRTLGVEHRFVSLRCVSDPVDGTKLDTALWTGVRVDAVLEDAGVPADCCVMARAEDDYFVEFPVEALRDGLLAFEMNGKPLPRPHGAPVRLLVPGHWGEVNTKWITELELLADPEKGYWERRGWHGTGPVNTVAKLSVAERDGDEVTVAGHAYAGTRGISAVEVSTDGGETWTEATLGPRLPGARTTDGERIREGAMDAWRQWKHEFTASEKRDVVVRAVESDGTVQPREETDAYPRGATGWVRERV